MLCAILELGGREPEAPDLEPELGVLLPCNVVVYEHEGLVRVSAADPERLLELAENEDLYPFAADIRARLTEVVESATSR